jgi:hypothetical protein
VIRETTAATDNQALATAKINTFEQQPGLFANRLLSAHHHTEPLRAATKAHRRRFRLMLNQRSLYLQRVYFRWIFAIHYSTVRQDNLAISFAPWNRKNEPVAS